MDVDNQAGTRGLELAGKLGIPVVIMEGLLGGRLSKAPSNVQALYDAFPRKTLPRGMGFPLAVQPPGDRGGAVRLQ